MDRRISRAEVMQALERLKEYYDDDLILILEYILEIISKNP